MVARLVTIGITKKMYGQLFSPAADFSLVARRCGTLFMP